MERPSPLWRMPADELASVTERFWSHVEKTDGCWLWRGARDDKGYGKFGLHGRQERAHLIAYELAVRLVPRGLGLHICHKCDNPPCVRPDHLFLGTPKDNMQDKEAKNRGRFPHGPRKPSGVVLEEES
jgi:hypothetical protein